MIVEIFLVFVGVAIALIVYGETTKELTYTVIGCMIFFILFGWVTFGKYTGKDSAGLEFRSGSIVNNTSPDVSVISYTYKSYDDTTTFWIGLFLTSISALAIIIEGTRKGRGIRR